MPTDRHLNLFYSYNRDSELIENNLTRAWIVSLKSLSPAARDRLLRSLIERPLQLLSEGKLKDSFDFSKARFALQSHMEPCEHFPHKYLLTLASNQYVATGQPLEESNGERPSEMESRPAYLRSIPDAWIFDEDEGYCFLIEAKVGLNPLDDGQIYSHAENWLGMTDMEEIRRRTLSITWYEVLEAVNTTRTEMTSPERELFDQEVFILDSLFEFIEFFGYRLFRGFNFHGLMTTPSFEINLPNLSKMPNLNLAFRDLNEPPSLRFSVLSQ